MSEFVFNWGDESDTESGCIVENFFVYAGDSECNNISGYNIEWRVEFGDFVVQSYCPYERTLELAKESAEKYINSKYNMFCMLAQTQTGYFE